MFVIPLSPVPSQIARVGLPSQQVTVSVYQRSTGLFIDVSVNDALVIAGVLCLDHVLIVRDAYLGFDGDLAFVDMDALGNSTAARDDPDYTGLGVRFLLVWLSAADLLPESS